MSIQEGRCEQHFREAESLLLSHRLCVGVLSRMLYTCMLYVRFSNDEGRKLRTYKTHQVYRVQHNPIHFPTEPCCERVRDLHMTVGRLGLGTAKLCGALYAVRCIYIRRWISTPFHKGKTHPSWASGEQGHCKGISKVVYPLIGSCPCCSVA